MDYEIRDFLFYLILKPASHSVVNFDNDSSLYNIYICMITWLYYFALGRLQVHKMSECHHHGIALLNRDLVRLKMLINYPLPRRGESMVGTTDPPVWHVTRNPDEFSLFTLHPQEIARQATLIENEFYRSVTPQELLGQFCVEVT